MLGKKSLGSNLILMMETILMLVAMYLSLKFSKMDIEEVFHILSPWLILVYLFVCNVFDSYVYYNKSKTTIIVNSIAMQALFTLVATVICQIGLGVFYLPFTFMVDYFLIGSAFSIILHLFHFSHHLRSIRSKKLFILGSQNKVLPALKSLEGSKSSFHISCYVALSDYLEKLKTVIDDVDAIYVAGPIGFEEFLEIYRYVISENKTFYTSAEFERTIFVNVRTMNIADESMIEVSPYTLSMGQAFLKRSIDIIVASGILVLVSPIFALTALAIKLTSPGPILYRQDRVTLNNRIFSILKFRSMTYDAEKLSGPILAQVDDSRITIVGKFIRATRIDELPQLINVLRGDMSMVGPRPERPLFVERFTQKDANYALRHRVRAGITGYAQVYGKYTSDFRDKLKFDLLYIKSYSLFLDVKLTLKTILVVWDKMSAKGQESDSLTPLNLDELENIIVL